MAIYVPDSTRRRRLVLIAAACLLVGLVVGFVLGRATAAGVDDSVAAVRDHAEDAVTALQRLPIEYEQALASEGGEDTATITGALERAHAELDQAYAEIDLFGPAVRQSTDAAFATLVEDVSKAVSQKDFEKAIDDAIAHVRAVFGLSSSGASG